jgi:DnaJ-class molecular chaperone
MNSCIPCINCGGKGKVSKGYWFDEMEQFLERFEVCPICEGSGTMNLKGGKCKKKKWKIKYNISQ